MTKVTATSDVEKVWQKTVDLESEWVERYAVIDEYGKLVMFEDVTKTNLVNAYDLSQWPNGNVTTSSNESESKPFRLSLETDEGAVHFAFESQQQRDDFTAKMKKFVTKDVEDDKDEKGSGDSNSSKIVTELRKYKLSELIKEHIDLKLFERANYDDGCKGHSHCDAMERIVQSLDLFQALRLTSDSETERNEKFIAFYDKYYGDIALVDDYTHLMDRHSDPQSVRELVNRLRFGCDGVGQCKGTLRHFRERGAGAVEEETVHHALELTDTLHFYLCHLEETGLRVPSQLIQSEMKESPSDDEQDQSFLVDAKLKRLVREIAAKQKSVDVPRLDGANNTKFNISTTEKKESANDGLYPFHFSVFFVFRTIFHFIASVYSL